MSFVLDGSLALAWCFDDEKMPVTEALFDRAGIGGVVVPLIWPAEVLNGLLMAEWRKRISSSKREEMAKVLYQLLLNFDSETNERIWTDTVKLANQHRLTIYDATYLELALRLKLPLATLDKDLQRAGKKLRLEVWGA